MSAALFLQAYDRSNALVEVLPAMQILGLRQLSARSDVWDDLVARASSPNPHYSRHVLAAHREAGLAQDSLSILTVWTGDRLDAALPFRTGFDATGLGRLVAQPFVTPFMSASTPLVAGDIEATLAALVRGLYAASGGRSWRWPLFSISSQVGAELLAAMREAGWQIAIVEAFERPMLDRRPTHDGFLTGHPNKSRLKDLRRRQRRLSEIGTLTLDTATEGAALAAAVEAFLELEAKGWKGAAGTALRSKPQTLAFARALFRHDPGPVSVRADSLSLDGRPLAISLALVAGGTACLLKTTYDEAERAHAPGLVLEAEIVRAMHETGFARRLDSATLPGSALESLYRERETMAEVIAVPPGGGRLVGIERRVALAKLEHRARAEAKRLLRRR